ncbi:hypothetical protein BRC90_01430 [Halobacteriales archaeon QS_4_69_34]|jgi:membrane protein YdbS with pleckstrin-like domain|nr:MAG: hypothetical protein BRC90_01430 [Halobacteriales archaeon QS_4_69_34]
METLDPRVRVVWFLGALASALAVGVAVFVADRLALDLGVRVDLLVFVALAVLGGIVALLRYRVWRFEVQEDALYLERGVLTRVTSVVPFVRVQHVDTQRGPVERLVGLSSVVVYTAGSRGADVTVPGLAPERADAIQQRLRALAIESEPEDAV